MCSLLQLVLGSHEDAPFAKLTPDWTPNPHQQQLSGPASATRTGFHEGPSSLVTPEQPAAQTPPSVPGRVKPYINAKQGPAPKYDPCQAEAPALFGHLPFRQDPGLPSGPWALATAPFLSASRLQEVLLHLEDMVDFQKKQRLVELQLEVPLSAKGVKEFRGVHPDTVAVKNREIGRGGFGVVTL